MLQIPYKDISENNKKYNDIMTKIIVEINKEEDLDPRLWYTGSDRNGIQ